MNKIVTVLPDKSVLVQKALELTIEKLRSAIAERDRATLVLAGGSTPKPLYESLAQQELPWEKIHLFWGDERYVPPDHPDSNEGMTRQALIDRISIPPDNVHPMGTQQSDPTASAQAYDEHLQRFFELSPGALPKFDVVLLGMGDDGHTASLFPKTDALQVCDRLVTVGNKSGEPRLTLTIPVLNCAQCVLFLVAGANKQSALAQVFALDGSNTDYPSRFIQPEGDLYWLLDTTAAPGLPEFVERQLG